MLIQKDFVFEDFSLGDARHGWRRAFRFHFSLFSLRFETSIQFDPTYSFSCEEEFFLIHLISFIFFRVRSLRFFPFRNRISLSNRLVVVSTPRPSPSPIDRISSPFSFCLQTVAFGFSRLFDLIHSLPCHSLPFHPIPLPMTSELSNAIDPHIRQINGGAATTKKVRDRRRNEDEDEFECEDESKSALSDPHTFLSPDFVSRFRVSHGSYRIVSYRIVSYRIVSYRI